MNERRFLKQINSKLNKDGDFTCIAVNDLLQEEKKMLASDQKNSFQRILGKFRKVKSAEAILADNFETIISKTGGQHVALLCKLLTNDESIAQIVLNNFDRILERVNSGDVDAFDAFRIFLNFREVEISKEFILANREKIIPQISPEKIFRVASILKGISEELDDTLNEALENHKLDVTKYLLESSMSCEATGYRKIDKEFLDQYSGKLLSLIETALQDEQMRMIDIKDGKFGSFTKTFPIGEKILKIGAPMEVSDCKNHPRILEPIQEMDFTDSKGKIMTHVEIMKKVELLKEDDMKEDDLYEVYQDLREASFIWTDVKFSNVGKVDGKLVIIDRDFIYREDRNDILLAKDTYAKSFEKRYLQEKTNNQAQAFKDNLKIQPPIQNREQGRE